MKKKSVPCCGKYLGGWYWDVWRWLKNTCGRMKKQQCWKSSPWEYWAHCSILLIFTGINILIRKVGIDQQLWGLDVFQEDPGLNPGILGLAGTSVWEEGGGDPTPSSNLCEHYMTMVHRCTYIQPKQPHTNKNKGFNWSSRQGMVLATCHPGRERQWDYKGSVSIKCTAQSGWINHKVVLGQPKS